LEAARLTICFFADDLVLLASSEQGLNMCFFTCVRWSQVENQY